MGGKRWTKKEEKKLTRLIQQGYSYPEVVDKFDRTISSLRNRGNKLGLRRNHNVDYDFFSRKDEISYYVLGYWYADGCIMKKSGGYYFSIVSNDKKHLKKIADVMKITTKIYKNSNDAFELRVGNKKLIENLMEFGGQYRKTKEIEIDKDIIPDEYFYDFLRGYFDGDGGYQYAGYIKSDGTKSISNIKFTGAENIIKSLYRTLNKGTCYPDERKNNCYYLNLYGDDMRNLLHKMYSDAEIYLERKYKVYKEHLSTQ